MKKNNKGFSLIEIVVVLAIMGVIAAFLAPMLFNYMSDSKLRRAQNDVQQIANCIGNFNRDTGVYPVYSALPCSKTNAKVLVLVSTDGINAENTKGSCGDWNDGETDGASSWTEDATGSFLKTHLESGKDGVGAKVYNDATDGLKKPNEWKGPYMTDFKADPWGNKYYVSTEGLWPGNSKAAFVLSAGPNATIETKLSQIIDASTPSITIGGDDIAFRIK